MKANLERHARQSGFTLIELLVVLAILAMLAGLVGPKLMSALGGAKSKTARVQIHDLAAALDMYHLDVGHYPSNNAGLSGLVENAESNDSWNGPYLSKSKVPMDPWGNEYRYRYPGDNGDFDLFSLGADNAEGGDGEDRDIGSWE